MTSDKHHLDIPASRRISRERAEHLLDDGGVLVDVRTPSEYRRFHPPGAVNIPLPFLSARYGELEDRRPIIVYCCCGKRSTTALHILRERGIEHVFMLEQGGDESLPHQALK